MYKVVPFKRWHIDFLLEQGDAEGGGFRPDAETLRALETAPNNWTLLWEAEPLLCGGTLQMWPGRHTAWAFMNKLAAKHMVFVTRHARTVLGRPKGRVEFTVRKDFEQGHRWAGMLGFKVETPVLENYGPEGEDHVGYVKMNGE